MNNKSLDFLTGRLARPVARRAVAASLAGGVLALTFLIPQPAAQADKAQHGNPFTLAGTWRLEVASDPPFADFVSYETFTEAGGSVETDHGPGGPCAGIGSWTRIGPRKFLATLHKQLFAPASGGQVPFEPVGTVKIRRLITLSADGAELSGVGTVEIYDPAGNLVVPGVNSPFQGTRVVPEPPDL